MVGALARRAPRHAHVRVIYAAAIVALAILMPLVLFAGLWIRSELDDGRRDAVTLIRSRAVALSTRLDGELQEQFAVLQAIAAVPSLDAPDLSAFQDMAGRLVGAMPQWTAIALLDPASGGQLVSTRRIPRDGPVDAARRDVVQQVVATRRPALRIRRGGSDGLGDGPAVAIYVPVVRNGEVRGVLAAGMRASEVQRTLESQRDPRFLSAVIDADGFILAQSDAPERAVGRRADPDLVAAIDRGASGQPATTTLDGHEMLVASARSPLSGWTSVEAGDAEEIVQLSERSTWATAAAGLLAVILAAILALFLYHSVVQRRLADERLAASRALGDLDARLLLTTQEALAEQRKSASEREVLLREIYHRVKNNLQIIQSLLRLGSRDLDADQREPFESAIRRIGAMARVHTLLYNSPDLASIDFKDYLTGLASETADAFGAEERGLLVKLDAASMRVPLDTAVPLAFIAVEILTNAFKHAFPGTRRGRVTVRSSVEDDHGMLSIEDDGIGLPPEETLRRRLGLTIVGKLAQQIGGTIEQPAPGGSRFSIRFPLKADTHSPLPKVEPARSH
jgi:two-component sensor histidine kinase